MKNKLTIVGLTLGLTLGVAAFAQDNSNPSSPVTAQAATAPAANQANAAPAGTTMLAAADQSSGSAASSNSNGFSPNQVSAIQQIVHDYLVKNPDVLVEASQALQAREMAKAQQNAVSSISQNKDKLFNDPNSPVMGSTSPNTTLVEFLDYQCGHCKNMSPVIAKIMKQNPNLKVIVKELPIFGAASEFAAKAALASAKQNKFDAFHSALLGQDGPLSSKSVLALAKKLGIDIHKLQKDMASPDIAQQIRNNFQLAQNIRLMGTPAFILTNADLSQYKYIPGATTQSSLQQQIDALSSGNQQKTSQQNDSTQMNAPAQADNQQKAADQNS